jgi:glycosyltransferase involved in cell wall biosynthesis
LHVLVVNWQDRENPQAGGAEIHLHEIFGRIARRHRVTLLCSGFDDAPRRTRLDGIEVHRVGSRYTFQFAAYPYWDRVLRAEAPDVVVEDLNKIPVFVPFWGARRTVALVHHLFGEIAFQEAPLPMALATWLAERPLGPLYRYRDVPFQAVSRSTADDLVRRGIPDSRIRVIYQGIDSAFFTPEPAARAPEPVFAYLGRLKRYKRVDLVLEAFARLNHPTARLEIAGSGDHRPALEALARSLDLRDRVRFLGFIPEDEKRALLRRAWSLVFTSPKEGWGITNLEAAACGTPVVASSSPGIRESVIDGETGYLVPHGDVQAVTDALSRLAGSPALVRRLGEAGRRFAERFTWDRAADDTEAHLQSIVQQGG